ncbi:MAG: 1,4-alpha-glucan branching protein domain-containing protein [Deltaproteobacteria bacterium]|nr:1,4-alpha-glucan branching protein domain-containing protein [Deltaproteobacteria bacterium]
MKTSTGVVILGRDPECAAQVWNARIGFPGDPAYRERYRDLGCDAPLSSQPRAIGIKLHRVTGKDVPASEKAPYDPSAALRRTQEHARIFVDARIAQLKRSAETGRQRVITACYDAELFGHWWYEGPLFLCEVLRLLSSEKQLSAVAPSQLESIPSSEASVEPACSTWGAGSSHQVWLGPQNEWLYRYQHAAERGMNELLQRFGDNRDDYSRRTIQQCGRELLLLQASDWAFMLATGSHASYARRRFTEHFQAFRQLHDTLLTTAPEPDFLSDRERATPIFPQLSVDAWR